MKFEDIDDFSDSIFSEDPLDNVEGDEEQVNERWSLVQKPGYIEKGKDSQGRVLYGKPDNDSFVGNFDTGDVYQGNDGNIYVNGNLIDKTYYDDEDNMIAIDTTKLQYPVKRQTNSKIAEPIDYAHKLKTLKTLEQKLYQDLENSVGADSSKILNDLNDVKQQIKQLRRKQ